MNEELLNLCEQVLSILEDLPLIPPVTPPDPEYPPLHEWPWSDLVEGFTTREVLEALDDDVLRKLALVGLGWMEEEGYSDSITRRDIQRMRREELIDYILKVIQTFGGDPEDPDDDVFTDLISGFDVYGNVFYQFISYYKDQLEP